MSALMCISTYTHQVRLTHICKHVVSLPATDHPKTNYQAYTGLTMCPKEVPAHSFPECSTTHPPHLPQIRKFEMALTALNTSCCASDGTFSESRRGVLRKVAQERQG